MIEILFRQNVPKKVSVFELISKYLLDIPIDFCISKLDLLIKNIAVLLKLREVAQKSFSAVELLQFIVYNIAS
jgi:hypothetical protein